MVDPEEEVDVVVVGAGFAGLYCLYNIRKNGLNVKVYEAGSDLGGTWYWNCYPGARCDSNFRIYQIRQDEKLTDFEWKECFPDHVAIREYFRHVDNKLQLSQDIQFNTRVSSAEFCNSRKKWHVRTETGKYIWAAHFILGTGFASRRYTPPFKGLDNFKGECYHTGNWPHTEVDFKEKRVAVIGTGASGVQVIQEIGSEVAHLTVYQRTPNMALPMQQYTVEDTDKWKVPTNEEYKKIFDTRLLTASGGEENSLTENALDITPEERRRAYEEMFQKGGFFFWNGTYKDILLNQEANDTAYEFWCEKTRARINDPVKKDILAPLVAPHAFGTKRPSLEQRYYEVFNQNNVDIINVRESPIIEVTENGIISKNEGLIEFDVIVLATGFDSVTGGILDISIKNGNGDSLQDKWKNGVWTNLGMTTAGFPNMFFLFGPQAPTAFSNGPSCIEVQGRWITNLITTMKNQNLATIDPTRKAEEKWKYDLESLWNASLFCKTESWYNGANIPGKPIEPLNFLGGIPTYIKELERSANNNYDGFVLA